MKMEYNSNCDTVWEFYRNGKFADLALNVDENWQEGSSQINQNNGLTISNEKNTQIAQFSLFTPKQSKFIKPVDMAIISLIPQGDPELTTYLNELLRTNKPGQQNKTFWFATIETLRKTQDHTPIKTWILTELLELKEKSKLNPREDLEFRTKFLEPFDWTDTPLTEAV